MRSLIDILPNQEDKPKVLSKAEWLYSRPWFFPDHINKYSKLEYFGKEERASGQTQ